MFKSYSSVASLSSVPAASLSRLLNWPDVDSILKDPDLQPLNYPKYDLIDLGDGSYQIDVAVSGFTRDQINVQRKNDKLTISADPKLSTKTYVHQGIARRSFKLGFTLGKDSVVKSATFANGILSITVDQEIKDDALVQIDIL